MVTGFLHCVFPGALLWSLVRRFNHRQESVAWLSASHSPQRQSGFTSAETILQVIVSFLGQRLSTVYGRQNLDTHKSRGSLCCTGVYLCLYSLGDSTDATRARQPAKLSGVIWRWWYDSVIVDSKLSPSLKQLAFPPICTQNIFPSILMRLQ